MDEELLEDLKDYVSKDPRIKRLDASDCHKLYEAVARHFGFPKDAIWWWEHVPKSAVRISYNGNDGIACLESILPQQEGLMAIFITDDDPSPWVCFTGPAAALLQLLRSHRFFEYFIVDPSMNWIVFDTHDNSLIGLGLNRGR
jgi:hypothetical protein